MLLLKFRQICREMLAQGIAPTVTRLAEIGYAYPADNSGGARLKSGRYATARREEYLAAGWSPIYRKDGQVGRYVRAGN